MGDLEGPCGSVWVYCSCNNLCLFPEIHQNSDIKSYTKLWSVGILDKVDGGSRLNDLI